MNRSIKHKEYRKRIEKKNQQSYLLNSDEEATFFSSKSDENNLNHITSPHGKDYIANLSHDEFTERLNEAQLSKPISEILNKISLFENNIKQQNEILFQEKELLFTEEFDISTEVDRLNLNAEEIKTIENNKTIEHDVSSIVASMENTTKIVMQKIIENEAKRLEEALEKLENNEFINSVDDVTLQKNVYLVNKLAKKISVYIEEQSEIDSSLLDYFLSLINRSRKIEKKILSSQSLISPKILFLCLIIIGIIISTIILIEHFS